MFSLGSQMNKNDTDCRLAMQDQQEQAMAGTLAYRQELIDAISVPLFFLDLAGNFIGSNEAFSRFVGKTDEEIRASGVYQLLAGGNSSFHESFDRILLETGAVEPFEGEAVGAGGRYHEVIYRKALVCDAGGNHTGIVTTIIDLSDLKGVERALRASESQKKAILDGFPGIIALFDVSLSAIWVNDTVRRNMERPIGRLCREIICKQSADCDNCAVPRSVIDGQVRIGTHRIEHDGESEDIFYEVIGTPVKNEQGNVESVIVIARDVTDRFLLERQLRHAQKMEAIGTLAGGVAHDFNNVLTPIMGYAEIIKLKMRQEGLEDQPIFEYLGEILKAGKRAKSLVDQILTFSRSNEQKESIQNLYPIVKEVIKLMRVTLPSTIHIDQDLDQDCGTVFVDPVQIHQVLVNLCTNSAEAIGRDHGTLLIKLKKMEYQPVNDRSWVQLVVEDNGCGMDPDLRERIFDPYFTTKEKGHGTGMGLALVHSIVSRHRGKIEVESEEGSGTTFTINFPRTHKLTPLHQIVSSDELVAGEGHVLLVDDEPQVMQVTSELLQSLGYKVTSRVSATEALREFSLRPGAFDLLLTDLTMPKLTGVELCVEIKKIRPDLPTILFTGYSDTLSKQSSDQAGIDDYCKKPVSLKELSQVVGRLLNKSVS
jgi:PAS domain S-box-containing protein